MKVFWSTVSLAEAEGGFGIRLDDKPIRTPAKAPLIAPTQALAEAIAEEWRAQEDQLRPAAMPLTRAANSTIDRVSALFDDVAAEIAGYGETDLLCYRATHPKGLTRRQAEAWDPVLDWAARALSARLSVTQGVMAVAQPVEALAALRAAVWRVDPWGLTALHALVTLSGSLILGLAVVEQHLPQDEAWRLSRIDEDWNAQEWGRDAEAEAMAERKRAEFETAARMLRLLA